MAATAQSTSEEPAPASWLSKLSIRFILPAAIVLPVLVVSIVLTLLANRFDKRMTSDLAEQNIRQIHWRIVTRLRHFLDLSPSINAILKAQLDQKILSFDDPARSRQMVFEILKAFPDVSSIVLGSAHGQHMSVIRYPGETGYEFSLKPTPDALMVDYAMSPDGAVGANPLSSYEYDPTKRPWYRAAVEANGPTWGNVYVWVRGGKGVTLGVPYVQPYRNASGQLLGVINCELTLGDISAFLKRLQIGKTGLAFIIQRDGSLVANSIGLDCMKNGTNRLAAVDAPDQRIADAARKLPNISGELTDIDGVRVGHAVINNQPTQIVISPFHHQRNLDWLIVTLVPDSDFLAEVDQARTRRLIISSAAVVVALLLGILLALWLLRPIVAVASHARRVGSGELNAQIHRHDYREITQLCDALHEMAAGLQDRMKLRHALDMAMEVQQSLLPGTIPKIKGLDIAGRSKYCDETGGDYYDYLEIAGMGPNSIMVAMGDVTGHGIAAAMLMATARGVLRSQAKMQGSLGALLTHVNEHLVADTGDNRFMTMFLAVIDVSDMAMRWASAGHDQPILYDPKGGVLTEIDPISSGLPLGVEASEVYEEHVYRSLHPGQIMLVGTDGLWEAMNPQGEQFGKERVGQVLAELAQLSAAQIEAGIFERLQRFCGGRPSADDITYVIIKFTADTAHSSGEAD